MTAPDLRSEIGRRRRLDGLWERAASSRSPAIDHRDALTAAHARAGLEPPTREQAARFKAAVIRALAPHATGVMLDPEAGGLALAGGAPGPSPVVMPLEAQGYSDVEAGRVTSSFPTGRRRAHSSRAPARASSCCRTGPTTRHQRRARTWSWPRPSRPVTRSVSR